MSHECQYNSLIIETRKSPHGYRRRRQCGICQKRFTTYEMYGDDLEFFEDIRKEWNKVKDTINKMNELID